MSGTQALGQSDDAIEKVINDTLSFWSHPHFWKEKKNRKTEIRKKGSIQI